MAMVGADAAAFSVKLTSKLVGLVLGWQPPGTSALSLRSSNEPSELFPMACHKDSTINIIEVIIRLEARL